MSVRIEPGGDLWARLQHWLHETIAAIDRDDLSRLPPDFARDKTIARQAYESVLMAMEVLETGSLRG